MKAVTPVARHLTGLLIGATLGGIAIAAKADGPSGSQGLRWSGYGTLGLLHVDAPPGWKFLRDITQRRTADEGTHVDIDSRLGLQANWRIDERWELVAQGVARERARSAPLRESVEWAFVAYRPTPAWQLRVGRISPDLFLLADYRNVGFAYPWVRPPVESYGWMPFYSMDGADVEWRGHSGDLGGDLRGTGTAGWRARLFVGRTTATMAGGPGYPDPSMRSPRLYGLTLSRDSEGLTLKATVAYAWSTVTDTVGLAGLCEAARGLAAAGLPQVSVEAGAVAADCGNAGFSTRYASLGATWERGPWTVQAEWTRIGGSYRSHNATFAYLSTAWRHGDWSLFGLAGRARPHEPAMRDPQWGARVLPLVGPALAAQVQMLGTALTEVNNVARHDQRSLGLGLRWDVRSNVAWKLQVDRVRVASYGAALWSNPGGGAPADATLVSSTIDFVF